MSEKRRVTEAVTFENAQFNEAGRTISGLSLLSTKSKNGYRYLETAMRAAVGKYNGVQVYISHPTAEELRTGRRDVMKLAGRVENPRYDGGKIRGDVVTLPDVHGQKFYNVSKLMPESLGCSHCADIDLVRRNGDLVVEEIKEVFSVDLVASPATTNSMFESAKNKRGPKIDEDEAFKIGMGQSDETEDSADAAYDVLAGREDGAPLGTLESAIIDNFI